MPVSIYSPRNALFMRTGSTLGTNDADPNLALPGQPTGVVNATGGIEGAPFETPETFKEAASSALMLAMARTALGTSQATCSTWIWDNSYNSVAGGNWVLVDKSRVIVEGAPVVIPNVRGANVRTYVQVAGSTGVSGLTGALLGFVIPQP
jgi:hypothetical protein